MPPPRRQYPAAPATAFDAAQEERILAKYEGFIARVAWKAHARYGRLHGLDLEDLVQEGRLRLLMAVRILDWDRYSPRQMDAYLCTKIKMGLEDYIRELDGPRSSLWRKHGESVEVGSWPEPLEDGTPWEPQAPDYPVDGMLDLVSRLNKAMGGLCGRDRRVVLLAALGHDNVEIARMVGDGNGGAWGQAHLPFPGLPDHRRQWVVPVWGCGRGRQKQAHQARHEQINGIQKERGQWGRRLIPSRPWPG